MIHSGKFGFLHISIFYRKKNLFHPLILRQLFYKSPSLQLQPQVLVVIVCFKLVLALIRMKRLIFGSLLSHVPMPPYTAQRKSVQNQVSCLPISSAAEGPQLHA